MLNAKIVELLKIKTKIPWSLTLITTTTYSLKISTTIKHGKLPLDWVPSSFKTTTKPNSSLRDPSTWATELGTLVSSAMVCVTVGENRYGRIIPYMRATG